MIITELQAETTYSVTVAAYTTKGDGARSKPKLITTTGAGNVITAAGKSPALLRLRLNVCMKLSLCSAKLSKRRPQKREESPGKYCHHWACKMCMQVIAMSWCDTEMLKAHFRSQGKCSESEIRKKKNRQLEFSSFTHIFWQLHSTK